VAIKLNLAESGWTLEELFPIMEARASESTRDDWLEDRQLGIGGSEAAGVVGLDDYQSPLSIWSRKRGLMADYLIGNEAMEFGREFEPILVRKVQERTGYRVIHWPQTLRCVHVDYEWMRCTPDGLAESDISPGLGLVQIKTTSDRMMTEWVEDGVPLRVQVQVQHEMAVTGARWAIVGVLFGGQKFLTINLERDDEFIEQLIEAESAFWNMVQSGEMPAADGLDATEAAIKQLYPRVIHEQTFTLPVEAEAIDQELQDIASGIEELEKRRAELRNQIRLWIGEYEAGELPNGKARYTCKTVEKQAYQVAATSYRQLVRREIKPKKAKGK